MGLFDGLTGSVPVPTSRYEAVDVINLRNLNQSFDTPKGKFTLFKDFSLDIKDFSGEGQFISILGKSGCGKSQLLKIISGLTQPDLGAMENHRQEKFLWYFNSILHFHGCQFLTM